MWCGVRSVWCLVFSVEHLVFSVSSLTLSLQRLVFRVSGQEQLKEWSYSIEGAPSPRWYHRPDEFWLDWQKRLAA